MELVELLDKIDETAPVTCETCRHMASHAKCRGCLDRTKPDEPYPYRNHEPGNWLRELQAAERAGHRNIVIGGQGEADFCALSTPEEVSKHLHYVAEDCGYFCYNLRRDSGCAKLKIITSEGCFLVTWDKSDTLEAIFKVPHDDGNPELRKQTWPYFKDSEVA